MQKVVLLTIYVWLIVFLELSLSPLGSLRLNLNKLPLKVRTEQTLLGVIILKC